VEQVALRDDLLKSLRRNAVFQSYLEGVCENTEEFHEIREIIARYDTLLTTHEVIHQCLDCSDFASPKNVGGFIIILFTKFI